ncbi:MAG TPA: hypothetical protein VLU47_08720 [Blastocatellia bacterium]|nr:hypothetical protein [Blastocatellia bacterium]
MTEGVTNFLRHVFQALGCQSAFLGDAGKLFFRLHARTFDLFACFDRGVFQSLTGRAKVSAFDVSWRESSGHRSTDRESDYGNRQRLLLQNVLR